MKDPQNFVVKLMVLLMVLVVAGSLTFLIQSSFKEVKTRLYMEQSSRYSNAVSKVITKNASMAREYALIYQNSTDKDTALKLIEYSVKNSGWLQQGLTLVDTNTQTVFEVFKNEDNICQVQVNHIPYPEFLNSTKNKFMQKQGTVAISNAYPYKYPDHVSRYIVSSFFPILDKNFKTIGYVSLDLPISVFQDLINQISINYKNYFFIVGNDGTIIAHTLSSLSNKHVLSLMKNKLSYTIATNAVKNSQPFLIRQKSLYNTKNSLYFGIPIWSDTSSKNNWTFVTVSSWMEFYQETLVLLLFLFITLTLLSILFILHIKMLKLNRK
jgi:hypothetical protein